MYDNLHYHQPKDKAMTYEEAQAEIRFLANLAGWVTLTPDEQARLDYLIEYRDNLPF